jgi:hypothetical protein
MIVRLLALYLLGCSAPFAAEPPTLKDLADIVGQMRSSDAFFNFSEHWPLVWVATEEQTTLSESGVVMAVRQDRYKGPGYSIIIHTDQAREDLSFVSVVELYPARYRDFGDIEAWGGEWPGAIAVTEATPSQIRNLYGRAEVDDEVATTNWEVAKQSVKTMLRYRSDKFSNLPSAIAIEFEFCNLNLCKVRLVK